MEKLPEFISNHPMLFAAAALVLGIIIINEWRIRTRGFKSIHTTSAVSAINAGAQIVDIRPDKEFNTGQILNAVHLPQDRLEQAEKLLKDKEQNIILVCKDGYLCPRVATKLVGLGYSKVDILNGGMRSWQQDNLPIVT